MMSVISSSFRVIQESLEGATTCLMQSQQPDSGFVKMTAPARLLSEFHMGVIHQLCNANLNQISPTPFVIDLGT